MLEPQASIHNRAVSGDTCLLERKQGIWKTAVFPVTPPVGFLTLVRQEIIVGPQHDYKEIVFDKAAEKNRSCSNILLSLNHCPEAVIHCSCLWRCSRFHPGEYSRTSRPRFERFPVDSNYGSCISFHWNPRRTSSSQGPHATSGFFFVKTSPDCTAD